MKITKPKEKKMISTKDIFDYAADRERLSERLQSQIMLRGGSPDSEADAPYGTILDLIEKDPLLRSLWQRATNVALGHLSAWPEIPESAVAPAQCLLDALIVTELGAALPGDVTALYNPQAALDELRAALLA